MNVSLSLSVDRIKEQRDAYKYPRRKCVQCIRYPCFKGQGTPAHTVNFAAYGCINYNDGNKKSKQNKKKQTTKKK